MKHLTDKGLENISETLDKLKLEYGSELYGLAAWTKEKEEGKTMVYTSI